MSRLPDKGKEKFDTFACCFKPLWKVLIHVQIKTKNSISNKRKKLGVLPSKTTLEFSKHLKLSCNIHFDFNKPASCFFLFFFYLTLRNELWEPWVATSNFSRYFIQVKLISMPVQLMFFSLYMLILKI